MKISGGKRSSKVTYCPMAHISPGDDGGQGSGRPTNSFPTGTLAEQTLGPPESSRAFPRVTTARTEARPPATFSHG